MTSTNDGKEVKINQTSGPKGKAHFIELFKSLDSRLNEASLPSERTKHLCEAWRKIHDICLHSTASAHDHLLSWLQRHTARVVLQTAWQRPERKDDRASLEEAINVLILDAQTTAASRNGPSPAWEAELATRGEWFKRILEHPWQHPVLTSLLNATETPPSDDEVLEWLQEERGITFVVRLQTLAAEKQCDDIAMTLATAVMDRVRRDEPASDCHETKDQSQRTASAAFGDRLKEHAGFTTDVWELLVDIEFVLLHKRDSARCIDLAKQTPLRTAHDLIERLQSRQDTSPRDKRLWRSAKEVAMLIAQVVITRCMMIPQCKGDARAALYRCAHSLARLTPIARLPAAAAALAAPAPTAAHLHLLAAAIDAQLAQKNEVSMKPFLCEMYVRAITAGMNELERLKLKTEKEKEARAMEQTLASWIVQLGAVLGSSTRFKCECALTAFSLHPSPQMYEQIKAAPQLPSINTEPEETSSEATNSEFGSWASDSRSQTNFVKTSETLKMKARRNQANVLSTAILNECEGLGLSLELCQDITVLLSGPRLKTLSWDMDRELLLENCRGYLERTHGGTKALTTELKYLNLNPKDFQYLPEEEEDENNLYYGIEKGYEHLVETEPEEIWEDLNDFANNAETSSDDFEYTTNKQRKKKTKKPVSHSDEDDPLSQVAEAKRKEKKERPHSKERSKERKRDKSEKKPPVDPLELNADNQIKEKPKRERKKKEKAAKPDSSLSNLVGLKVAKPRDKKNAINNDVDSQGQSSIQSLYSEENIIYDGQFSMDDIRSPRSTHSADDTGLMQNAFLMANGKARFSRPHQHQSLHNKPHRKPGIISQRTASLSEHSRKKSPNHVSDDVRNSISRLMEFRRLKALEHERRKPNAIIRPEGIAIDNNVSPKGVAIPEIPKSYINKQQSEKLKELKKEVDNILKQRQKSSAIPSPVIQYASKNTISSPPCQSYYASQTKFNINAETPPSRTYTPAPEHRDRPDRFTDSVNYVSIYDKDETSYSQNPFPASSPNQVRRPSNASIADVNYQDYLHEFHKQSTYNHYAEKAAPNKKVIRPSNRVTPVVPKTKSEQKPSQSAKQILQKPEGSLNTFSRMNYYKNKQTDSKKSQDLQSTIGDKLDGFILDHLLNSKQAEEQRSQIKAAQAMNNSYVVPRTHTSTKARDHPAISSMLQNTTPAHNHQPATPKPTIHQSDQRDFLQFLQQQNVVPGPSTTSLPPSNRQCAGQSNVNKPSNSQIGIQATNHQMIKPNDPKKSKEINIISSSIIKSADTNNALTSHPVTKRPPGQWKPRRQENRVQKPSKPETTVRKTPEEWENVMNAILRQKTPSRGPKALEIALNKSSFEKAFEESLKSPTSLFKTNASLAGDRISRIEYNRKELVKITKTKTVSSTTSEETISITERKTHAVLTTEVTRPSQTKNNSKTKKKSNNSGEAPIPFNQVEKCLQKHNIHSDTLEKLMRQNSIQIYKSNSKVAQNELPGKASKPQSNIFKPNDHVQAKMSMTQARFDVNQDAKQMNVTTKHDTRPNVENNTNGVPMRPLKDTQPEQVELTSGIPSSDYDLLEELMDDDLRKEIGELSSDEESYNAAAQGFLNDVKNVKKPVTVEYNQPSNNLMAEAAPQNGAQPPICKRNLEKHLYNAQHTIQQWPYKKDPIGVKIIPATKQSTSTMSFSTASVQNVTTHIVTRPVQVSTYNANMTHITVQPNLYITAAPQPVQVQNVMLFSPTLVYENYAAVQAPMQTVPNATHIAVNVAPNSNLYQTNQFVTPVASPHLISSALTSVTTVPSKPSPVTVVNAPEYLDTSSELHQQTYEATAKENLITETNLNQLTYVASAQKKILPEGKKLESVVAVSSTAQIPNGIENKPENRTSADTNVNKICERKVLIEVQEKQTHEKIDCKRRAQKSLEKDVKSEADNERLIRKRMAIIDRKISHVCGIPTIALGYSPLRKPSPTQLHGIDNKVITDEDHPTAINNIQELNKDIKSPATPDSFKENKIGTAQVRRILLRSSNKLKNKNLPSTLSKLPSDKKVKVAPDVSLDTLTKTAVQNDQSDIGTNSKQKRVSKRIRNKTATPKDNSILKAKVIRKVPSKKEIATKKRQDDLVCKINVPPLSQDSEFLDVEAAILGSTIPKGFPINLLSTENSENSSIGTKENVENQMSNKKVITPSAVAQEKNHLLDENLPESKTTPGNTKIVNIPTTTEASISEVIPIETMVTKEKVDGELPQDIIPIKEESASNSTVLTYNELMPVEFVNIVENTDYLTKKTKVRSTSKDKKTLNNVPEKVDSLQDHNNGEIAKDPKYVLPPTTSQTNLANSPQMSFSEDGIKIEEIIDPNNRDPLKKIVRIKLSNGKTFKGTISGSISFESLLENPEIKSMLMSQFQQPKKLYSLKLNVNKDRSNGTKIIPIVRYQQSKQVETVSLLSDDEDEVCSQVFTTEFGKFKVNTIDSNVFTKHQNKFKLKCNVQMQKLSEKAIHAPKRVSESVLTNCVIKRKDAPRESECDILNKDTPQECVILNEETPQECVILNEKTPQKCVILNEDTPKECVILNEETPQECVILNQDTPQECVLLNEDTPKECVILNEETPEECVILNQDTPKECVILNEETLQECAILNEDTPQELVILNEDTSQECVLLNEESPEECVILNEDNLQECVVPSEDTPQECVIPIKEPVQECIIPKKETQYVLTNKTKFQDPQILSTSKYVENILKDFENILALPNAKKKPEEPIVLIDDDSSNDSVDIAMGKIDVLKNMLLKELGVDDNILSPTSKSSEDVQVTWASEAIDLTDDVIMEVSDSTSDEESSNKYQKILNKKCFVKLVRCDHVMNQPAMAKPKLNDELQPTTSNAHDLWQNPINELDYLDNKQADNAPTTSNDDDKPEDTELKAAPISRSGSISILEDFPLDDDLLEFDRTSPVMEVYDMIASLKTKHPEHIRDLPVEPIDCESEWMTTKKMNKLQSSALSIDSHLSKRESEWTTTNKLNKLQAMNNLTTDCNLSKCGSEWLTTKKMNKLQSMNDLITGCRLPKCELKWMTGKKMIKVQSVNDLTTDCYLSKCESEWLTTKKMSKLRSMKDLTVDGNLCKSESEWLKTKKVNKVQSVNDFTTDGYLSKCESEWLTTKKMSKLRSMNDLTVDGNLCKSESEWLKPKKIKKVQSVNDLTTDCYLSKCESEWLTTKKMSKLRPMKDLTTDCNLFKCESEWTTTKKMNKLQTMYNMTSDCYLSKYESEWMTTKKMSKLRPMKDLTTDCNSSKCESEWTTTKKINKLQTMYNLTSDCYLSKCESEWMTTKKGNKHQSMNDLTNCHLSKSFAVPNLATLVLNFIQQGNLVSMFYGEMRRLSHISLKRKLKPSTLPTVKISKLIKPLDKSLSKGSSDSLLTVARANDFPELAKTAVNDRVIAAAQNIHDDKDNLVSTDTTADLTDVDVKILSVSVSYEDDDDSILTEYETKFEKSQVANDEDNCSNQDVTLDLTDTDVTKMSFSITFDDDDDSILTENNPKIEKYQVVDHDKNGSNQDATPDLTDTDVKNLTVSVSYDDEDSIFTDKKFKIEKSQMADHEENCNNQDATPNLTDTDVTNLTVSVSYDDEDSLLIEKETIFIKSCLDIEINSEDATTCNDDSERISGTVSKNVKTCKRQDATTSDDDSERISVSVSKNVGTSVELDESSFINSSNIIICMQQNGATTYNSSHDLWENATTKINEDNAQPDNLSNEIDNTEQNEHNNPFDVELPINNDEFYEALNNRFGQPDDEVTKNPQDTSLQSDNISDNNLKDTVQHVNQPPQTTAEIYDALNKMFGESERPDSTDMSVCNTCLHAKSRVSVVDNANDNSCDELNATLREGLSQTEDSCDEVLVEGVVDMIHGDFIEDSVESALQSEHNLKEIVQRPYNEDSDIERKESSFQEMLKNFHDEDKLEYIKVLVPKRTYFCTKSHTEIFTRSKGLKRKKDMTDVKTSEKKYRKGKNIDYPKISTQTIAELAYAKEYKRIIDYSSTIKFSYARPFHIDYIDVEKNHEDWPILAIHSDEITDSDNANLLYSDTEEESAKTVTDPLKLTLNDEIVNGDNVHDYNSIDIKEINFNMGFGEKSGRVIQKIETGNTKLSAATLSDVKQYQPFPMSEIKNINLTQNQEIETQKVKLQFMDLIGMKQKVKSIFKKTTVELTTEILQDKKYATNEELSHRLMFPFDFTSTEFMELPCTESIVNVVQVGQMTINATAQNPLTCDPRVTHVSDASPSQCSENSNGEGPQSNMETEYTELTTANIGLPLLQEYSQHHQLSYEGQNSEDGNGTMSIVKIELMEEETSQEKQENDNLYEHDFSPLPNTNVEYSFEETSNTLYQYNPNAQNADNAPSSSFNTSSNNMDTTLTHVFTCSTNIDGSYTNMETSSSIDSSYASMENASTTVYSTLSNVGSSPNEMENSSNLSDSSSNNVNDTANLETRDIENPYPNMYSMRTGSKDVSDSDNNSSNIASNVDDSHIHENGTINNNETTPKFEDRDMENTAYDYTYENIEDYTANMENNNNGNSYSANEENYRSNGIHENFPTNIDGFDSNTQNYSPSVENYSPHVENYPTNIVSYPNVENYDKNNPTMERNLTNISNSTVSMLEDTQPQDLSIANSTQGSVESNRTFKDKGHENGITKTDQLAHAMSAAGISSESVVSSPDELVSLISQGTQPNTNNYTKQTQSNQQINVLTLQQALAQVLPPPLNQSSLSENQVTNNPVPPQVLHIVQGNNGQTVINKPNGTHLLHIVQNKSNPTTNGLSLVETGLQQGGNQLIHIVNNGSQNNAQFLKRVNLMTNLQNAQGSNEQKMIQLVCKSADGKSIQLNTGPQRSMVLRLHPSSIQTKPPEPDLSASSGDAKNATNQDSSQEIKSRSMYEENYAQFIQNSAPSPGPSTSPCQEKSTSLPKFNQVFGKQSYQDNPEMNHNGLQGTPECSSDENNVHVEQPNEPNNLPSLASNTPPEPTQAQAHPVQQIKQAISPMNIQTMHGGVIYTRQIPVNIGGGQTINLITVPSTEMVDDSSQKQQPDVPFVNQEEPSSIIKLVPHHSQNNQNVTGDSSAQAGPSNEPENTPPPQAQPVLTQMRIKLPMLSKGPHIVPGTRLVRPFFQIQRNVIAGANQPVYQQLVLTTAPSLGQTIRLPAQTPPAPSPQSQPILVQAAPHSQPSPHIPVQQVQHAPTSHHTHSGQQVNSAPPTPQPVQSDIKEEPESELNNLTLEQLREFDMVLEQVKERSVHPPKPRNRKKHPKPVPADSTDGPALVATTGSDSPQQVLFSADNSQPTNIISYVNRKSTITASTSFARSPDSSGIMDTPSSSTHVRVTATVSAKSSSDGGTTSVAPPKKKKKKKSSSMSLSQNNPLKPQEDEQTTQRILYILAEYKEQVENSPDKNKPAPRRRNLFPPTTGSKRKRGHCSSRSACRREGAEMSPTHEHAENGEDSLITLGSEDSSCGTTFSECTDCQETHSPDDSSAKVVRRLTFEHETTTQTITQTRTTLPQRSACETQTITVARTTTAASSTPPKPTTTVLMPANYLLPVSMIKGGQQIAIMTNRGPKILVGAGDNNAGAFLFQRLIGPGLKPVLTRPGVRHIRLPATALHNLQAFNIQTTPMTQVQPPDSTALPPTPAPPNLVETRAMSSSWPEREVSDKQERGPSPDCTEPWNIPSSSIADDYGYEEIVRTDNMERTVLDAIPDRYSPDMEAQRIFDKMFDVDSKKSMYSPRCGYDIDTSDGDDKPYPQVVQQRKDGRHHRVTHVSTAALRHKYAILEHELRLQKSLSEECEDLGVDSPSASDLFPEADILFGAPSPAHEQTIDECVSPPPIPIPQSIPQPDIDDQIATDRVLTTEQRTDDLDLIDDVGEIVTVGEDGTATIPTINAEEFAKSHPNTTFHTEPEEGEITIAQTPFTIAHGLKRHITFHANRVPGTVVIAPQASVISQATINSNNGNNTVKFTNLDNIINAMPGPQNVTIPSAVVKDGLQNQPSRPVKKTDSLKEPGTSTRQVPKFDSKEPAPKPLSKFDSLLHESKLRLNQAYQGRQVSGTQVIRRLDTQRRFSERDRPNHRSNSRFFFEEPPRTTPNLKHIAEEMRLRNDRAMVESMGDNASSPGPELFWDGPEKRYPVNDSEKVAKSPFDELLNDSSAYGPHTRLDSVIKAARPERTYERTNFEGIGVGSEESRPLRTYPAKRPHTQNAQDTERHFPVKSATTVQHQEDRKVTQHQDVGKKTPRCHDSDMRRTGRGMSKRNCSCCNIGSTTAPPKKRSRPKKPKPQQQAASPTHAPIT